VTPAEETLPVQPEEEPAAQDEEAAPAQDEEVSLEAILEDLKRREGRNE